MEKIDFVVPYVDSTDKVWRKTFFDYCKKYNLYNHYADIGTVRYQDNLTLITYQLRLVEKNMPWINKIYLLVSNKEQVPSDLSSKVVVVLHKDFIPVNYLPTFNSTTIEMFLWNIPNLSEHFIYANDDMLPCKELNPDNFFTDAGKIKINFLQENKGEIKKTFRYQCENSYYHLLNLFRKDIDSHYLRPEHSFTPMIKSHCKECFDALGKTITRHIRAFRTVNQHNQYIYPIYEWLKYGVEQGDIDFLYSQCETGVDLDHQIVCLNMIPKKLETQVKYKLEDLL